MKTVISNLAEMLWTMLCYKLLLSNACISHRWYGALTSAVTTFFILMKSSKVMAKHLIQLVYAFFLICYLSIIQSFIWNHDLKVFVEWMHIIKNTTLPGVVNKLSMYWFHVVTDFSLLKTLHIYTISFLGFFQILFTINNIKFHISNLKMPKLR